ncbi:MAG: flagellar protein FlaG [Sterolibacteriaceae bacterium]|uniref:Flagellar protein FlaG n=1 Tax=Candidatus Methylophosphatis roskildensis TaxID=2899263 RepID=A0A9D7DXD2_9PROT|nr:flagellar protein FlaG [Candidatus Methylophosphatis roskildensis]MBK7235851.1 flagellar protein FlaG [Sterolibacteriaceae bacterium]
MEIARTTSAVLESPVAQRKTRADGEPKPAETERTNADAGLAPASAEQVEQAVKDIRKVVSAVASDLQFSVDKDSGRTMVRVVDAKTKEVIRQIPGEEVLAMRRALDKMKGLLLRMEA